MNHDDHVNLLRPANLPPGGAWADLGAGSGAFTLALRELVGAEADIYAVDKDRGRLGELDRSFQVYFRNGRSFTERLHLLQADFSRELDLPVLDGILMANSLHYFKDKERILRPARGALETARRPAAGGVQRRLRQSLGAIPAVVRDIP
jgi:ubiquinone/menaquinone biosynthesis C-methylase UbiE